MAVFLADNAFSNAKIDADQRSTLSGCGYGAGSVQCPRQMEHMEQRARPQERTVGGRRTGPTDSSSGVLLSGHWKPELLLAIGLRVVSISPLQSAVLASQRHHQQL